MITGATRIYGLLGYPVTHSLSPVMQNAAFTETKCDAVYLCFSVPPNALHQAVEGIRGLGIQGANVTIPHKIAILKYLDKVDSRAADIGAVNTIVNQDGVLVGYNTDGLGAYQALEAAQIPVNNQRITLVGAGGTTKAIAYHLAPSCKSLVIINRTEMKAIKLALTLQKQFHKPIIGKPLTSCTLKQALRSTDLLINTTSVGMYPECDRSIIPHTMLHSNLVVFDVVYNPLSTRLLREAREAGATTLNGLQMLVHQGAQAFRLWTDLEPPISIMYRSALHILEEKSV